MSLQSILRAVRSHLGMEVGFISEFRDGRRVFRHVESADGADYIQVGGSDPLEESYCYWIAEGRLPRLICDPREHSFAATLGATERLPVGAHLSVPIKLRDGRIYGTFCCFSTTPDRSLTDRDMAVMEAFAETASDHIQQALDSNRAVETKLAKIRQILRQRDVHMVFQPAVRVGTGLVEFFEALARFPSTPYQSPDRWFATAAEVGLGTDLELLAVGKALEELKRLPANASISVNVSPRTIVDPAFASLLEGAALRRMIIEITEHDTIGSYGQVRRALRPLRSRGLRVAIDDTGAGYSSFRHILQIRPDLIKLDMSIASGIDKDPARRALTSALVVFSREIGSQLVAEGVETEAELETLRALGIDLVQGFFLSQPLHTDAAAAFARSADRLPKAIPGGWLSTFG